MCSNLKLLIERETNNLQKEELSQSITNKLTSLEQSITIVMKRISNTEKKYEYIHMLKNEVCILNRYIERNGIHLSIDKYLSPIIKAINALEKTIYLGSQPDSPLLTAPSAITMER